MDIEFKYTGIKGFSTEAIPIGGKIKVSPIDFKVEEISDEGFRVSLLSPHSESGSYLLCRVNRENISHQRMVKTLARHFKVRPEDIETGGIKDKKAVVKQLVSIYEPKKHRNFDFIILEPGLEIQNLGFRRSGMVRGHIKGNYFDIIIRNTSYVSEDLVERNSMVLKESNILNYYGIQRFGGLRPINYMVGRAILEGDYKTAVKLYVGEPSLLNNLDEDRNRITFLQTMDPELALSNWIGIGVEEKAILEWLVRKPNDYEGAIKRLPRSIFSILRRSFISYLWNLYLSFRPRGGVLKGERSKIVNGHQNIEVALPSKKWPKPINSVWEEIFATLELRKDLFKTERHSTRFIYLTHDDLQLDVIDPRTVRTKFSLGTGQYATVFLRELMRSPLENYI